MSESNEIEQLPAMERQELNEHYDEQGEDNANNQEGILHC